MASRTFASFLKECKENGYEINLIFLWLHHPELALARVKDRVQSGGHNISEEIVLRRYQRSIANFFNLYIPLSDSWIVYDNSLSLPDIVAQKNVNKNSTIVNQELWQAFERCCYE